MPRKQSSIVLFSDPVLLLSSALTHASVGRVDERARDLLSRRVALHIRQLAVGLQPLDAAAGRLEWIVAIGRCSSCRGREGGGGGAGATVGLAQITVIRWLMQREPQGQERTQSCGRAVRGNPTFQPEAILALLSGTNPPSCLAGFP